MARFFKFKSIFFIVFALCFVGFIATDAFAANKSAPKFNADRGYQGNSFQEYNEFQSWGSNAIGSDDCFSSGKIFTDQEALTNTQLPQSIGRDVKDTAQANVSQNMAIALVTNIVGTAAIGLASFGIGFLIVAVQYGVMVDACSNTYVLSAAEQVSFEVFEPGDEPKIRDKSKSVCHPFGSGEAARLDPANLESGRAYTSNEIPYLFHCEPNWDPFKDNGNGGTISETTGDINEMKKFGRTYGYAGKASTSCNLGISNTIKNKMKANLGSIVVGKKSFFTGWRQCMLGGHGFVTLKAGDDGEVQGLDIYAFYFQHPRTGKIRLCAIAPYTMFPVMVGCGTVAPPSDDLNTDEFIRGYVQATRCEYLLKSRTDLESLGNANMGGAEKSSVNKFLRSDLHLTSTVVGCVKDMLLKIFMGSPTGENVGNRETFFEKVQNRMRQMVMAALTLYVSLIGIKIMTAGQPPTRAEGVMYIVKFALVFWFATGDAWYRVENNTAVGLYPSILEISEELTSIFLEAQNRNDPLSTCRHVLPNGQNILANNEISVAGVPNGIATSGHPGVIKTTVWDLVDCKVVNYLSFGTCDYTLSGMMSAWLASGLFWKNPALAIACLIYAFMVMITVFKFAHIFILSIFTITILVFLSPLFLCFALFEPTKGMFQKWMQMILGYMLYPALLFAFVSLMFATFDAVFYGNLNIPTPTPATVDLKTACTKDGRSVDSIYCINMAERKYVDPCTASTAELTTDLIESKKITGLGEIKTVSDDYASKIYIPVLRLMLFSLLFYLFLGSIAEFMATLVGVQGLGGMASGLPLVGKLVSVAASAAKAGASKAGGAAAKAIGKKIGRM
jgi:type IV secretion system protein VirB6